MTDLIGDVQSSLPPFIRWLNDYGETSYDHQSFFAGSLGRSAKRLYYRKPLLGTLAVAPMILCEAFLPSARRLFWKRQRFPIADAHYASGFAFLGEASGSEELYRQARHFLTVLLATRCPGYDRHCWGYPFDWETRNGVIPAGTPMITSVAYMYEAFEQVYRLDKDRQWLDVMRSIAEHAFVDYHDLPISPNVASCSYTPNRADPCGVVNASAYRAFLLIRAGCDLNEPDYRTVGERNLNFVLDCQNENGSWPYSIDGVRGFVDHFHTCFVLKALAKIETLTGCRRCTEALERGVAYYVGNLFDERQLPKPFSQAPRMTVYRRELYDYAECINVAILLHGRFPKLDMRLRSTLQDVMSRWRKPDGSFRARQLLLGWDNVPMHRWAQAQLFRSLCFFVNHNKEPRRESQREH